jgi:glucose-6-phosphate dehydrogenase assembly protein OpcA
VIALWDTTGDEVIKALGAERRNAGGVASGQALTLVASVDEKRVREAESAAATAAAAHPCRLIIVVRRHLPAASAHSSESRLDAEIVVGGRLGPGEAVVLRMHGRLARHAESVVIPLLAPDVPVVTWWHGPPPDLIATDPLGVLGERRITDTAQAADPVAALRQRAVDYAPGDTDLAWTRTTAWRAMLASALDTANGPVTSATISASTGDPTAELLRGWLTYRLRIAPTIRTAGPSVRGVALQLAGGEEVALSHEDGQAIMTRTGLPERSLPLGRRSLGDELAEELRRLDNDQPYAYSLEAATGVTGLNDRPAMRVHIWHDPEPEPTTLAVP